MADQMKEPRKFCEMNTEERFTDLEERVNQFNMLQLPGQPMATHMGTSYLVGDLFSELQKFLEPETVALRRITVVYDIVNDCTEVRHRAGKFFDYTEIDGDVTKDEERLAITDQIAALNFKRWQEKHEQ